MSTKQSRPAEELELSGGDDFQIINGIGPGIERRLHGANIRSYAQLAALSTDELAGMLSSIGGMSRERIIRQDWIGQARELALEHALAPQAEDELEPEQAQESDEHAAYRTPYANFTVELLLDDDRRVRRTRVRHVQAGQEDSWAGWDNAQLVGFFARYADVGMLADERPAGLLETGNQPAELSQAVGAPAPVPATLGELTGQPEMSGLTTAPIGVAMSRTPHADEPFLTTLTMDLTNVQAPGQGMLEYSVTLLAKKLGDRQRITLGEARGLIQSAQNAEIGVECAGLGRGIYRLEVATTLRRPEGSAEPADGLSALLEGGLLQIL